MTIYSKNGRMMIPVGRRRKRNITNDNPCDVRYVVDKVYCPRGCNLIDKSLEINGFPGIRLGFKRQNIEGEFVISAIEGDFEKQVLRGELEEGIKDELFCPHCGEHFRVLVDCKCSDGAEMLVLGLTPKLNYNNAITFCNVTGCSNGSFIRSGEVIRHVRLVNCC
ncbi:MAG: hypothetical protein K9G70_05095 [Prolixibacteraceae bacterium]|nr:hypothetical protein [Prolixibacteraceae bacterium]